MGQDAYDTVSRLASWTASGICGLAGSTTAPYTYNAQRAITTVGLSAAAGPWAKGTTSFAYSGTGVLVSKSAGGVTARTYGYDPATGACVSEKPSGGATTTVYTWSGGPLAGYSDSSRGSTATYTYDANGQRTRSVVSTAGGTTSTDYVYQGLTLLSLSATSSGNASYTMDYLYDGSGRPYAGFYRDETTAAAVAFDIVTTDRGDVAELAAANGTAFALYRYDPWGNSLSTSISAGSMVATLATVISARQPLRYAGYAYDSESGLYYCSARYFDPVTCQFISKDAARADGEDSAYQYCGGNPAGGTDSSGLQSIQGSGAGDGTVKTSHNGSSTWEGITISWKCSASLSASKVKIKASLEASQKMHEMFIVIRGTAYQDPGKTDAPLTVNLSKHLDKTETKKLKGSKKYTPPDGVIVNWMTSSVDFYAWKTKGGAQWHASEAMNLPEKINSAGNK